MPSSGSTIHTRSASHPDQVVVGLLAEHRVARALGAQPLEQQRVGLHVAFVAEQPRVAEADALAHRQQQLAGFFGEVSGQRGVAERVRGRIHRSSIAECQRFARDPARW